jgi:short-subunit dehydrogenase
MRVAVITGASDGIGAEFARQWAAKERSAAALVLSARSQDKLEQVAHECRAYGAQVLVQTADVAQQERCIALIEAAISQFGRIDILVNNAGMSAHALLEEVDDLSWYESLMRVNFWGSVWCTHAALPHLKATQGRIVGVSSLVGLIGVPGRTAYAATKSAMNGFFESLRVELIAHGVSVTLAYPGVVNTEIRRRGFNAQGHAAGASSLDEGGAMSVVTCAKLIVDGMEQRQRDVVMTWQGKLGRWLKLITPGLVDRRALAALSADARIKAQAP